MKEPAPRSKDFWKLFGVGMLCLLLCAWVLRARLAPMAAEDSQNRLMLDEAAGGFNESTTDVLRGDIEALKARIFAGAGLFNPQQRWLRKGYDVSILFVEELNNANEFLKREAQKMQVEFPGVSFTEKLPGEDDAVMLLTQLYGIREVAYRAIKLGADIIDIKPLKADEEDAFASAVILPATIELVIPHGTVVELLIGLTGIVPKIQVDAFSGKTQEEGVEISMTFSTVYTDFGLSEQERSRYRSSGVPDESYPQGIEQAVAVLRSVSPFAVPVRRQELAGLVDETTKKSSPEVIKPRQRFFFRGRASLHGKEVVVIEDTLRQETVFMARGDQHDRFRLKDFSGDGVILESIDDRMTTIINWEDSEYE